MVTCTITGSRKSQRTLALQIKGWICLPSSTPIRFNGVFRHPAAVSLLRHLITPHGKLRNINRMAIGLAARLILRTRLTPG